MLGYLGKFAMQSLEFEPPCGGKERAPEMIPSLSEPMYWQQTYVSAQSLLLST